MNYKRLILCFALIVITVGISKASLNYFDTLLEKEKLPKNPNATLYFKTLEGDTDYNSSYNISTNSKVGLHTFKNGDQYRFKADFIRHFKDNDISDLSLELPNGETIDEIIKYSGSKDILYQNDKQIVYLK